MTKAGKTIKRTARKTAAGVHKAEVATRKAAALLFDPTREAARRAFDLIQAARDRLAATLE